MTNKTLIELRNKKGLSQVEVAKQAKISTRQYQRLENEGIRPNVKIAIRLAKILGITVEELFS